MVSEQTLRVSAMSRLNLIDDKYNIIPSAEIRSRLKLAKTVFPDSFRRGTYMG